MDKFKIGLIGSGNMGRSLATSANRIENIEVACVSDLDQKRAEELANEIGSDSTIDYRELLDDNEIQAVLIASPPFVHAQIAIDSANAGKHVFSEKPMATTLEDCDAMINACEKNGVKLGIGLVCRFHATHSKVREIVHSGDLGKPTTMLVHRIGGPWSGDYKVLWRFERAKSGGTLMEVNSHEIDFMRWVCGEVTRVYAVGGTYIQHEADYPDLVLASLNFDSGAVGVLHSGMVSAIGGYGGRVDCEKGSIYFPQIWGSGEIQIRRFDGTKEDIPISSIKVQPPVQAEISAFVDAVINDETPPITGKDGRATVEIAIAAYNSIESGRPINLPIC